MLYVMPPKQQYQYGVMSLSCQCCVIVMSPVPSFLLPAGELNIISMGSCHCHVNVVSCQCHAPYAFLPVACWGTEQHHQHGVMSLSCPLYLIAARWGTEQHRQYWVRSLSCPCHVTYAFLLQGSYRKIL